MVVKHLSRKVQTFTRLVFWQIMYYDWTTETELTWQKMGNYRWQSSFFKTCVLCLVQTQAGWRYCSSYCASRAQESWIHLWVVADGHESGCCGTRFISRPGSDIRLLFESGFVLYPCVWGHEVYLHLGAYEFPVLYSACKNSCLATETPPLHWQPLKFS
jgi:hypothetical protein